MSRPLERQDRMYPKPVSNINATRISDKDISLIWDPPDGDFDSFDVQYLDATKILIQVIWGCINDVMQVGECRVKIL